MPVVINDFEVVTEPPSAPPAQAAAEGQPVTPPLPAHEVERILRHERERALRVWAH
jgi:hypothetical protein